MDCYELLARTLHHMFAPFEMDDALKIVHDSDEKFDSDGEQITHPQEVIAYTHKNHGCFDDIEESH